MCPIYDVLSHFMLFCCKIVIYAVLSRYLFCRDLRAFAWRKIQPRITPRVEKWLIWGMFEWSLKIQFQNLQISKQWSNDRWQTFSYFKCKFHNEGLPGEFLCFLGFFLFMTWSIHGANFIVLRPALHDASQTNEKNTPNIWLFWQKNIWHKILVILHHPKKVWTKLDQK